MMTDAFVPSGRPFFSGEVARQPTRRSSTRVAGPLDGRRLGETTRTIRIHELNATGCLVECYEAMASGRRIQLQIDLAGEGWISVEAETLFRRDHFHMAVMFVYVSDANRARIERTIERVLMQQPQGIWTLGGPPEGPRAA